MAAIYVQAGKNNSILISPEGRCCYHFSDALRVLRVPCTPKAPVLCATDSQLVEAAAAADSYGLRYLGHLRRDAVPSNNSTASFPEIELHRSLSACTDVQLQHFMFWRLQQHASAACISLDPGWKAAIHNYRGTRSCILISPKGRRYHQLSEAFKALRISSHDEMPFRRVTARQLSEAAAAAEAYGLQLLGRLGSDAAPIDASGEAGALKSGSSAVSGAAGGAGSHGDAWKQVADVSNSATTDKEENEHGKAADRLTASTA